MANVVSDQVKRALETARKLEAIGEEEIAREIYLKLVKKVAEYHKVDLIALFYGEQVYENIDDEADALRYVFIARCAANAYDLIHTRGAAYSTSSPWANPDNTSSNEQMKTFFRWLQQSNRTVEVEDCGYFKMVLEALTKVDNMSFIMSDRIQRLALIDIVQGLVLGTIEISNGGALI